MAIDGRRSGFPAQLDDWGAAFQDNVNQRFHASYLNRIADALYNLQLWTRRILITGRKDALRTDTGAARPRVLVKSFAVTVTGSAAEYKTAALPAFTSAELALFGGTPLAAPSCIQLGVRKVKSGTTDKDGYCAALKSPVAGNGSGQLVSIAPLRDAAGDTNYKVGAGTYLITLLITR